MTSPNYYLYENIRSLYGNILKENDWDIEHGLCLGLTYMWIQAVLCGEHEETNFLDRLIFLCKPFSPIRILLPSIHAAQVTTTITTQRFTGQYTTQIITTLPEAIKCARNYVIIVKRQQDLPVTFDSLPEKIKMLLEIPAFIEGLLLYHKPSCFPFKKIHGQNPSVSSSFTMPRMLEEKYMQKQRESEQPYPFQPENPQLTVKYSIPIGGDINIVMDVLTIIFNRLDKIIPNGEPYVFNLTNNNHTIGLTHNKTTKEYKLFNQNHFSKETGTPVFVKKTKEMLKLTKWIFRAFFPYTRPPIGYCAFNLIIHLPPHVSNIQINRVFRNLQELCDKQKEMYHYETTPDNVSSLLYVASEFNHANVVDILTTEPEIEIDVNQLISSGATPLFIACLRGNLSAVKALLTALWINVNQPNANGDTPLHAACLNDHVNVVYALLTEPKIDVNKPNADGVTPLYIACANGYIYIVKALLFTPGLGIKINKPNADGVTPLYIACANDHIKVVKVLLTAPGIDLNKPATNGPTPLHAACWHGHIEIVKLLIKSGAKTNLLFSGNLPIHSARLAGHTEIVEFLTTRRAITK